MHLSIYFLMQVFQTISYSCTSKPDGFCIIQIHCSCWEGHDSGSNIWIICTFHPFCYEWFCPIKRYHESKTNKQSHRLSHYVLSYKISLLFSLLMLTDRIKKWWIWGFWISPMMYGQNAMVNNEFLGNKWKHVSFFTIFFLFSKTSLSYK
jgi:hypothetical protein